MKMFERPPLFEEPFAQTLSGKRLQGKKTPGHADMDQQDVSGDLAPADAKVFRTCVDVLLHLAADLPRCQHVVRYLAIYSTQPTMKSMTVLKHLVSYLACHEDVCLSLKWQGDATGTFHKYPSVLYQLWKPWLRSTQFQTGLATSRHLELGRTFQNARLWVRRLRRRSPTVCTKAQNAWFAVIS